MRSSLLYLTFLLLASCVEGDEDLCARYFDPYPDLISARQAVQPQHKLYVTGMQLYADKQYEIAADSLKAYVKQKGSEKSAHLYLAMCLLTMDLPFDAELHLDHLRNSNVQGYEDQLQWYRAISWVCSGQYARALPEARRMAALPRFTYAAEAARLARDLEALAS